MCRTRPNPAPAGCRRPTRSSARGCCCRSSPRPGASWAGRWTPAGWRPGASACSSRSGRAWGRRRSARPTSWSCRRWRRTAGVSGSDAAAATTTGPSCTPGRTRSSWPWCSTTSSSTSCRPRSTTGGGTPSSPRPAAGSTSARRRSRRAETVRGFHPLEGALRMSGPLDGVLVVDLTRALAGPHAAMMLGDLGARVIKVESPGAGDDTRGWGPPFLQPEGADRESTYFLAANRNKESITLDLKDDGDKALLTELLRRADVLLENFRPGTLARLGFGTDVLAQLNPRLVTLAISGFGHDGPEGGRAGYDQIAQGEGGLMSVTGPGPDDPQRVGVPIGDLLAGMYGAYGVLAALLERRRTGRGQVVRTSLLAAIVGVHAFHGTAWTVAGQVGRAQGNHHPSIAPYGLFHCADGSVQVACANESLWRRLCAEFGFDPEAPGMATNGERVVNRPQVIALLEGAFASIGAEDLLARLNKVGIPAGKVRTIDDVYGWGQTQSQGLLIDVDHATLGRLTIPGPPLRFFSAAPDGETETTRREHAAPPVLGGSNAAVRAWLAGDGVVDPGGDADDGHPT